MKKPGETVCRNAGESSRPYSQTATTPGPARTIRSREFIAQRAWDALGIAVVEGASVRLHWTLCLARVNEGSEVFVVLDGVVRMFYREAGVEHAVTLHSGDIFHARIGCEHVAHPRGAARILVIERVGSLQGLLISRARQRRNLL